MQKNEFIQWAAIATMHALLSQGAKDFDGERAIALASHFADKVYEVLPPEASQTAISSRGRKKITENGGLKFPYSSERFMSAWQDLLKCKKWRGKDATALQYNLDKLAKYEEDFAIQLMSNAIAGEYQGVVFPSTPGEYQKWLAEKEKGTFFGRKPQASHQPSKIEQNAKAAAEAARMILGNDNDFLNGTGK